MTVERSANRPANRKPKSKRPAAMTVERSANRPANRKPSNEGFEEREDARPRRARGAKRNVHKVREHRTGEPNEGPASQSLLESGVDEGAELFGPTRMPQLAERFRFDLADALSRDLEVLTHLFQGVVALLADAETHAQNLLFARR